MSQKLSNAVEAANILTDIGELTGLNLKTVVSACTTIIHNDIDSLTFSEFGGNRLAQNWMKWIINYGFLVSAKAHDDQDVRTDLRMLFRCVYDLSDMLEDREIGQWSGRDNAHWHMAEAADDNLSALRREQAA